MSEQDWTQSQYYQEDFLASHSVQPGSEEARKMTVTSGRKCLELYRRSDPVGSLVRTLLGSSVWRSTRCYLTWKASATPAKRLLFRLVPSMPRTGETDAQYWPTPTARDCKGANSMEHLTRGGQTESYGSTGKCGAVMADTNSDGCAWSGIQFAEGCNSDEEHPAVTESCDASDADNQRLQIAGHEPGFQAIQPENGVKFGGWWSAEPDVGRVAHGVPARVDRLKCLGNAVVPQQFYPIFRGIAELEVLKR